MEPRKHKQKKNKRNKVKAQQQQIKTAPVPPAIELPVEELLKMAQDHMETLHITEAQEVLERALAKYPNNVNVLDTLGELLFSLGEVERAITLHKRSVELEPNGDGHKYLNLAEFLAGLESVRAYGKGIELLTGQRQALLNAGNTVEANILAKQIASAHASVAELYMTDLCYTSFEENAENICEINLKTALTTDPSNADALQCLANLRILRERDSEASELLDKILAQVLDEEGDKVFNADFCKQTARLLMEIARYDDSAKVLEKVVSTSEDNVEAWYLLAYANYSAGKYDASQDSVNALHELFKKPDLKDKEIEEATAELEAKLKEVEKTAGEKMEQEDKDEDYEDISESEEDKKMGEEMEDQPAEPNETKPEDTMEDK